MKKAFSWFLMGLFALTFAACSGDDDFNMEETTAGGYNATVDQAVGKWQRITKVGTKVLNGKVKDTDRDSDPDRLVIEADGTWEYYDYDSEKGYELEGRGRLVVENGVIKGNGRQTFTAAFITNNILTIHYNEPDYDDGKTYTKYYKVTFTKIQ